MNLNTALNTAVGSLLASSAGLQATNNNIANANTPGYSRESVVLTAASDYGTGVGQGVVLQGYQSLRDEVLQSQIQQQTQSQSGANAQLGTLQQVQTVFASSTSDIGSQMSTLFSSLSSLSTDPSNTSLRQAVLTAGSNLANSFNNASSSLTSLQTSLNSQVTQDVGQINQLTRQIAALNPQITEKTAAGQDPGALKDQQDQLVLNLSKLTDVAITRSDDGVTVTTGNGTPLVVGPNSYNLQTTTGSDGTTHVLDNSGNDVTSTIKGGDLGGTLQARDVALPSVLSQLDTLAEQVGTAFNAAQAGGYDATGAQGSKFFNLPTTATGAAATIRLALSDPKQVAASSEASSGASGSNGNLAVFAAIQSSKLPSGQTPTDAYASLVYSVGSMTSTANATSIATTSTLQQLNDQRSSVSGVSIDEESTNLIRYQQAYEAAAKVVNTVTTLFSVTMNMLGN